MNKIKTLLFVILVASVSVNAQSIRSDISLMPWPKEIKENATKFMIDRDLSISVNGEDQGRVRNAAVSFLRRLTDRTGVFLKEGFPVNNKDSQIQINFESVSNLNINDDESYFLDVTNNNIVINANTDIGALRGIQTLLQLVNYNERGYYFSGVTIRDSPRFVWRGLMIDVARHFQPIDVLKRNLDAMASVKLNVFHWHLTDDQGFRVESKVYPKLHEKASDGL